MLLVQWGTKSRQATPSSVPMLSDTRVDLSALECLEKRRDRPYEE